jgi:hypothetical protein
MSSETKNEFDPNDGTEIEQTELRTTRRFKPFGSSQPQ